MPWHHFLFQPVQHPGKTLLSFQGTLRAQLSDISRQFDFACIGFIRLVSTLSGPKLVVFLLTKATS